VAGTCEHGIEQNAGNFLSTGTTTSSFSRTLMPAVVYVCLSLAYEVALLGITKQ